jgi:hypothetical protein
MKCSLLEVQPQGAPVCMSFIKGRYTDAYQLNEGVGKSVQNNFFFISQIIKDHIRRALHVSV